MTDLANSDASDIYASNAYSREVLRLILLRLAPNGDLNLAVNIILSALTDLLASVDNPTIRQEWLKAIPNILPQLSDIKRRGCTGSLTAKEVNDLIDEMSFR